MTQDEIKNFIAQQTGEGLSLSVIQDLLAEKGVKLSFLELRLIASGIESVLARKKAAENAKTTPENSPAPAPVANTADKENEISQNTAPADPSAQILRGKTTVSISPIQRPGYVACGSVSFGSGVSADWFLDQMGRLALDNSSGGKPDAQDLKEFQLELSRAFSS